MVVSGIPIAQLVVFAILFQPAIYVLFKHGKPGILGWICILSFCGVRIAGSIAQIIQETSASSSSLATLILSSIGLSPLLLACVGILHEARRARNPQLKNSREWFFVIQFHLLITVAMALLIIGIIRLVDGTDLAPSDSVFIKIGFAVILLCWIILLTWILVSLPGKYAEDKTCADGIRLLYAVLFAMPLLLMRFIYGLCYYFVTDVSFTNSVAAKVILSVVPEMIAVGVLVAVGLFTVNMWKFRRDSSRS